MDQYKLILVQSLSQQGAQNVTVERERDQGGGRVVFAVSADWSDTSMLNPGLIRLYNFEPKDDGSVSYGEVGLAMPVDLADIDSILDSLQ